MELDKVKDIAAIAAPMTGLLVETWIKPHLTAFLQRFRTDNALIAESIATRFTDYLERAYDRNAHLSTIVFSSSRKLADLYIPLTIELQGRGERKKDHVTISSYPQDLFQHHKRILVTDSAGMGKSTLMKFLFCSCVEANSGIPVFVELRRLSRETGILETVMNELQGIDERVDKELVEKLIARGDFVFFLDGYDEIPIDLREIVVASIHDFITKSRRNVFLMTSRPEASLASFASFRQYSIRGLKNEEAFNLIRKYDEDGELAEELIEKLRSPEMLRSVREFLENPLLVSLLYKSYEYKSSIPFKKHIFYRQVYDSLFENHDLTKVGGFARKKSSGLDIEDFHRILRTMAFKMVKLGKVEFDKDSLLDLIRSAREASPNCDFKEASFLSDLTTTVPLFRIEGDEYRWAHKSIQEYFAAQFICIDAKAKQDDILLAIYRTNNVEKYLAVLDLCYDMDYRSFRRTILYELAHDFIEHQNNSYLEFDGSIAAHDLEARRAATFQCTMVLPALLSDGSWSQDNEALFKVMNRDRLLEHWRMFQFFGFGTSDVSRGTMFGLAMRPVSSLVKLLARKRDGIAITFATTATNLPIFPANSSNRDLHDAGLLNESRSAIYNRPEYFATMTQVLRNVHCENLSFSACVGLRVQIQAERAVEDQNLLLNDI